MSKVSRSDIFVIPETGGSWFDEFLRICKDEEQLLKVITNKKSEGVAEIVKQYREATGMDLVKNASTEQNKDGAISIKTTTKNISIRQAKEIDIIGVLNNNQELKEIIDSFCMNSGGTKTRIPSLIIFVKKIGNDLVKFSDKDLIDYIEERKKHFKDHHSDNFNANDVGRVGIDIEENYEDQVADYYSHGK